MSIQPNTSNDRPSGRSFPPDGSLIALYAATAVLMIAGICWTAAKVSRVAASTPPAGPMTPADQIDFFDTASAWQTGKLDRLQFITASAALRLGDSRGQFPRSGTWTSPQSNTAFAFTELIPSYNPHCPPDTGLRFEIRVRRADGAAWSPWFYLGSWGRALGSADREIHNAFGNVDVDTLKLDRPADAYQARVTFYAFTLDAKINPALRRLAVCYSGEVPAADRVAASSDRAGDPSAAACDLRVPFRAQGNAARPLRPEICSPTSVSMVMQYLGRDLPTETNALAIYDNEYAMFGNWARACAWAGENGFDAWVARFRNWDQVKSTLAAGQPIIASIRFEKGQCPSFVLARTDGHLIVIRGFTREGDFIVNDPASREKGNAAVYKSTELAKAWLAHGGVGYLIRRARN